MATREVTFVLIRCPSCGGQRTVSERHARRNPVKCRSCPTLGSTVDELKQWWLENFSDSEICLIAESFFRLPFGTVDETIVASERGSTITVL